MRKIPKALWWMFFLGLVLRLGLLYYLYDTGQYGRDYLGSGICKKDSETFCLIARNIIQGNGFSLSKEAPFLSDARFPPIYPLLIAGSIKLFGHPIVLILSQILISAVLIPFLIWKIAGFLSHSQGVGVLAAALGVFEPLSIAISSIVVSDVISVSLMLIAVYFFLLFLENHGTRYSVFAGFFLALSLLTKPNAQFLFILVISFFCYGLLKLKKDRRTIFISGLGFAAAFILVLSPWLYRNYKEFGVLSVSATGPLNVYTDFAVSVMQFETGKSYGEVKKEFEIRSEEKYKDGREQNPALSGPLFMDGLKIAFSHPKSTIGTLLITSNSFFTQDLWLSFMERFKIIRDLTIDFSPSLVLVKEGPFKLFSLVWERTGAYLIIPLAGRFFWVAVNLLWVFGAVWILRRTGKERKVAVVFVALIFYFAAISMVAGFSDYGKHRYFANPFIFILASYGLFLLMPKTKALFFRIKTLAFRTS